MKIVKVIHDNKTTYIISESPNLGVIADTYENIKNIEILDGNVISDVHHGDEHQRILTSICGALQIPMQQLIARERIGRSMSLKRAVSMHYMRETLGFSLIQIGKLINKDHTTVLAADRKIRKILKNHLDTNYDTVLSYLSEINKTINRNN